jgi:S1-C subfamily serine protease
MKKGDCMRTCFLLVAVPGCVLLLACCRPNPAAGAQAAQPQPVPASVVPANQLEGQIETVYVKASPSVVNITTKSVAYDFFRQPVPQEGTGSGFIYDEQGHIVTNFHVIEGAQSISVSLASGRTYKASVVGSDQSSDLAVIKAGATGLPPALPMGDSSRLRVGQFVVALGNPFGLNRTLTFGVISALGRTIQSPNGAFIGEAIQTDTPINPGNSGGPLLDLGGNVIAVNSQIISPSGANAGIGFAVSAATVKRVVPQLIAHGSYVHPFLGVSGVDLSPDLAHALAQIGDKEPDSGILVVAVHPGSPAARAGLRVGEKALDIGNTRFPIGGDVITAINDQRMTSMADLTVYLDDNTKAGQSVTVTILRGGISLKMPVILAEMPSQGP